MFTRMVHEGAAKGSDRYIMSLNNLVSQLHRRIEQMHDDDLELEAGTLLNTLVSVTSPGTLQHGIAAGQLGLLTFKKFTSNNSLEDLDKALELCKTGFESLPPNHEASVDILATVVDLYDSRYDMERDVVDLERLVHYSELLSNAFPTGHRLRSDHLLKLAQRLKEYAKIEPSLGKIDDGIYQINKHLPTLTGQILEKRGCQNVMSDLLAIRYTLTTDIQDLMTLVKYLEVIMAEHNANLGTPGSAEHPVSIDWIWDLKSDLDKIGKGYSEDGLNDLVQQELLGIFLSHYEPTKAAINVMERVHQDYSVRLHVIADAIEALENLSEEEVNLRTEKAKAEKQAFYNTRARPSILGNREYQAFGSRNLAIDQETGDIMWDFNRDMMKEILGYDPHESLSLSKHEFMIRESRMEQLAIEKAQSKGRQPNLNLCRMCRDIAKPLQRTQEGYQLISKDAYLPFGNFYQLLCRKNCVFCRLVFSLITIKTGDLHPQLDGIDKEVQGTRLMTGTLSTGEKVMRIEYGLKHVGDIRVASRQNYQQLIRQARKSTDHAPLIEGIKTRDGPIYSRTGQQVDPTLIKSWLDECDCNHGASCTGASVHDGGDEMPMLFIDVIRECLVAATSREKYFALSYVWGRVDMLSTTKGNFELRQESQALTKIPFPKTIKDAMQLVSSLGERFLWIDAICMVQDDKEQMDRDIPRMNIVYGRAFATIVALSGDSADAGLPGVSPGTRRSQLVEHLNVSNSSPNLDHDPQDDKSETICLIATPRPLNFELEIAKWNTRGWVFQERVLSRRCLYFAPEAVYFQCAKITVSECGSNEDYAPMLFDKIPQRPRVTSTRVARDNAMDLISLLQAMRSDEERVITAFNVYKELVESYTRREFSFKSDVINGFTGVFAMLEKHFQSETYGGLPAAILAHALLWTPAGRLPRRGMRLPTPSNLSMGKPDMQFPSWSWAGWDGPVDYRLFEKTEGKLHLPTPFFKDFKLGRTLARESSASESSASQIDISQASAISNTSTKIAESSRNTSTETLAEAMPENVELPAETPREKPSSKGKEIAHPNDSNEIPTAAKLLADPARGTTWTVAPPPKSSDPWDPPLESNILSFTAPTVPVSAFHISPEKEYLVQHHHIHIQGKQAVRRIYDRQGNRCGLWWEQAGYGYVGLSLDAKAESRIHMVGVSEYGDVDRRREGPSRVEGEIRLFDDKAFPATGPGSGIVNILAVDTDLKNRRAVGYRVTVAMVHGKAWERAGPKESHLRLA